MRRRRRVLDVVKALFRAKMRRRRRLARLPFEEKIRIVAELQKMAGRPRVIE